MLNCNVCKNINHMQLTNRLSAVCLNLPNVLIDTILIRYALKMNIAMVSWMFRKMTLNVFKTFYIKGLRPNSAV